MQSPAYFRVINEAKFILINSSTIRETAKAFGISKSTVHKDLNERLRRYDPELYKNVKKLLKSNFDERYLRGGEATKQKYKKLKLFKLIDGKNKG